MTDTIARIDKTGFSCPHCNVLTSHTWLSVSAIDTNGKTPSIPTQEIYNEFKTDPELAKGDNATLIEWVRKMSLGRPFIGTTQTHYGAHDVSNLNISTCYNCKEISIWVHDRLIYPNRKADIQPNADLPDDVSALFNEAREIVDQSPKGAAALLRLCIQYLCRFLGEPGKNLDQDIATLVGKGLSPLVQKSLDIVRVIGNESVHPGEIDLNDNRALALQLFALVNLISEQMISLPKKVDSIYKGLPAGKLQAITERNAKAKKAST